MRISSLVLVGTLFAFSCKSQNEEKIVPTPPQKVEEAQPVLKESGIDTDGVYREYYKNGNTKIEGYLDQKGEKSGIWKGYSENGQIQSETFFLEGKKNGHTVVFLPNGKPKYIGEYKDDIKIGLWRFYDDQGNLSKEVEF